MEQLTYFILTRKIFESAIWRDDPHILKLFIYLIGQARHSKIPKQYNGFQIKRGELVTSLSQISENNEFIKNGRVQYWSRAKVSRMLSVLIEQNYIEKLSDTYGTHISICKYDTYQSPDTYKPNTTETILKRNCNDTETDLNTNKNDKKEENEKNEKKESKDIAVKTPQNDFLDNLIIIFSEEYLIAKGIDYITQSQDKKSIARLLASYKKKNKDSDSVKCLKDFRNLFRSACEITEDNFLSQISISFLNSQINKYLNYIKNGKPKQSYGNKSKGFDIDKERRIAERLASIN